MTDLNTICNDFKETTLWSNDLDNVTIFDFSDIDCQLIENYIKSFIDQLSIEQWDALTNNDQWDQFGHWLSLEMQGHGAGFFDSECDIISSISDNVESFNVKFESPYIDDGIVYMDFYEIGRR